MEEEELVEMVNALDDLDDDIFTKNDDDFEDGASLSFEFSSMVWQYGLLSVCFLLGWELMFLLDLVCFGIVICLLGNLWQAFWHFVVRLFLCF